MKKYIFTIAALIFGLSQMTAQKMIFPEVIEVPQTSKAFAFSIRKAPAVVLHDSGIEGNSVYVNALA